MELLGTTTISSMADLQKETDMNRARDRIVDSQIAARGIRDSRVLTAMRRVRRKTFVEEGSQVFATDWGRSDDFRALPPQRRQGIGRKIGSSTSIAAVMQTRSRKVEMPSGLSLPLASNGMAMYVRAGRWRTLAPRLVIPLIGHRWPGETLRPISR